MAFNTRYFDRIVEEYNLLTETFNTMHKTWKEGRKQTFNKDFFVDSDKFVRKYSQSVEAYFDAEWEWLPFIPYEEAEWMEIACMVEEVRKLPHLINYKSTWIDEYKINDLITHLVMSKMYGNEQYIYATQLVKAVNDFYHIENPPKSPNRIGARWLKCRTISNKSKGVKYLRACVRNYITDTLNEDASKIMNVR